MACSQISVTKKLYWPSSKTLYTIVQVMSYCHQAAHFFLNLFGKKFGSDNDGPSRLVVEGPGFDYLSTSGSILERSDRGDTVIVVMVVVVGNHFLYT